MNHIMTDDSTLCVHENHMHVFQVFMKYVQSDQKILRLLRMFAKILYVARIELYIHSKCSCCSSFHIMSYKRKTSGFNINKIKE